MTVKPFNTPQGLSVGNLEVIAANGDITNIGVANLGANSNVLITGGTTGQVLATDGSGNLSWITVSGGNGTPGGANTQVQFNSNGLFGGSANFTFDTTTNLLSATNISGNGAGLTSLTGANVTGTVPLATSATTAGTVTTNAQPNITSVGNLTGLNVNTSLVVGTNANLGSVGFRGTNGNILAMRATANTSQYVLTFPGNAGANGQYLATDGTGNLRWTVGDGPGTVTEIGTSGSGLGFSLLGGPISTVGTIVLTVPTSTALRTNLNIGNVANLNLNGNGGQVLSGNGAFVAITGGGTVSQVQGDGSGLGFTLTGNVTSVGNISLTVPDANTLRTNLNIGNIADSNLTGNTQQWLRGDGTFANIVVPIVGNVASSNFNGDGSTLLAGNGTWMPAGVPAVNGITSNVTINAGANISITSNPITGTIVINSTANGGGNGTPGGSNTQLQFNDNGTFGGIPSVTWDGTSIALGAASEVKIYGGSTDQFLKTVDGNGNLQYVTLSNIATTSSTNYTGNASEILNGAGFWVNTFPYSSESGVASLALAMDGAYLFGTVNVGYSYDTDGNIVAGGMQAGFISSDPVNVANIAGNTFYANITNIGNAGPTANVSFEFSDTGDFTAIDGNIQAGNGATGGGYVLGDGGLLANVTKPAGSTTVAVGEIVFGYCSATIAAFATTVTSSAPANQIAVYNSIGSSASNITAGTFKNIGGIFSTSNATAAGSLWVRTA